MKILIIDDDKLTTTALKHSLEKLGHQGVEALSAEQAIELVSAGDFDLIICDVMMPGISGLSLVTVLRSVHLCFSPIIMMSSLHNKPLVEAALQAGANGFLDKPVNPKELESKIKEFEKKKV
jgi:putative two-component system response regulator